MIKNPPCLNQNETFLLCFFLSIFYHLLAQKIVMLLAWCFGKKTWCFQRDVSEKTWCFSYDVLNKNSYFSVMFWKKKDIFDTLFKRIRESLRWKSWFFIMESKKVFHPLNQIFWFEKASRLWKIRIITHVKDHKHHGCEKLEWSRL